MSIKADLIKLLMVQQGALLKLLTKLEREEKTPEPEYDPPPKIEPARKGETEMERMLRWARNDIASGKAVGMNDIARSAPRLRPPRRPGQQERRWNGAWWHY